MWLPDVITSTPASNSASAVDGVSPIPPATFSPLAVTKSMPRSSRIPGSACSIATRPGLPMMSPIIRIRRGAVRARRVAVGRVAQARAIAAGRPRGVGPRYFAYSTARVSRITVTLIWPG